MNGLFRSMALSMLAGLALFAAGCESTPKAGSMKAAVDDYNSQQYSQSHEKAVAIQERGKANEQQDAAYLAGLAAYQMGQLDEAERRLLIAATSSNAETAANAKVMLGQIRMDQRRPRDAAAYFTDAYPDLTGDDARKCAYDAGVAFQQAGDNTSAKKWIAQSNGGGSVGRGSTKVASNAGSRYPSSSGSSGGGSGGFTLQVGAFREKNRAQQAAEEAQKLATRDGLGSVKIITRRESDGTMYVVQFGSFATRDAAAAARTKLGRLQYIVTPANTAS